MFRLPNDIPWISPCLLWQTSPRMQKALGGSAPVEDEGTGPLFVGPSLMDGEILLRRWQGRFWGKPWLDVTYVYVDSIWHYMTCIIGICLFIMKCIWIYIYIYLHMFWIFSIIPGVETWMESSIVLWFFIYRTAYKYMYIANTWNVNSPTVGFGRGEAVICGVFWDTFCLSCLFKEHFNTANQSKLISLGWSYVIINLYAELW